MEINNCNFTGVQFTDAATDAITTIAEALLENAKALGNLTRVLNGSNVTIETMVKLPLPENTTAAPEKTEGV